MAFKDLTFQSIGKGIKTFVAGKPLTPQQKALIEKRKKETRAYQDILSAKEKQAMQIAYEREITRQRQEYARKKETEAMRKGISRAQAEVQGYGKPKPSILSQIAGAFPKPQSTQNFDAIIYGKGSVPKAKKTASFSGFPVNFDLYGNAIVPRGKVKIKKLKAPSSVMNDLIWKS